MSHTRLDSPWESDILMYLEIPLCRRLYLDLPSRPKSGRPYSPPVTFVSRHVLSDNDTRDLPFVVPLTEEGGVDGL